MYLAVSPRTWAAVQWQQFRAAWAVPLNPKGITHQGMGADCSRANEAFRNGDASSGFHRIGGCFGHILLTLFYIGSPVFNPKYGFRTSDTRTNEDNSAKETVC